MDETDKKLIVSALRATIVSQKDGVELRRLNSDYRELEGEDIPYRALGFPSVEAYIRSLTNDFTILSKQGSIYVVAKKNDTLAHIQDLIKGQSKKKKGKPSYKSSRGRFGGGGGGGGYKSNYNNRSYKKPSPISQNSWGGGNVNRFSSNKASIKPAGYEDDDDPDFYIQTGPQKKQSPPVRRPSPPRRQSSPRRQSPPRRHSSPPSRERRDQARSKPMNRETSKYDELQEKIRDLVNDHDIQNNRSQQNVSRQPVRNKGPEKMPPPVPSKAQPTPPPPSAPRLLGPGSMIMSQFKSANMINFKVTVPNDQFISPPDLPPPVNQDLTVSPGETHNKDLPRPITRSITPSLMSDLYPPSPPTSDSISSSAASTFLTSYDGQPLSPFYEQSQTSHDTFTSSDASTLLEHLESLQLTEEQHPTSFRGSQIPPPDMMYLKSLLNRLKDSKVPPQTVETPQRQPDPEPQPQPSIPYLNALLHKLKSEKNELPDLYSSQPLPNNNVIPDNFAYFDKHLPTDSELPQDTGLVPHALAIDTPQLPQSSPSDLPQEPYPSFFNRSQSAFQSYRVEQRDPLDEEVSLATQKWNTTSPVSVPAMPPPLPNMAPVSNGPAVPFMTGNSPHYFAPSPLPSPALSLQNGASSSKSSSPEVFVELPPGATPEEEFIHLARYLFNDEPEIHIKERQPDQRNKKFYQYYAHVQVGTHPRISTLPNEYNTKEEARKSVILLALNQFNKMKNEKLAKSLKKTTEKLNLLIDRIYSLARNSSNGIVATKLEELYEKQYGEILPSGWTTAKEVVNHPRLEVVTSTMFTIIYTKTPVINHTASAALPNLVLPEEDEWPVFVTLMTSVSTVYVKLVNEMSEEFDKMSDEFNSFMNNMKPDPVTKVDVGSLYCLYDEDSWLRVEVMKPVEALPVDNYLCKYIDHGEESVHHMNELYPLYDMFRRLPAQAIELFLPESDVFEELFDFKQVKDQFVAKSFVALIRSRDSGTITTTLYNTNVEPNVNMNELIFSEICQLYNVSSVPEENMFKEAVYVSYISRRESCIYVQSDSLMFKYLISEINQLVISDEIDQHVVTSLLDLEEYLYYKDVLLAKFGQDGVYYRAQVLEVDQQSQKITVLFIDYGNTDVVSCNNLVKLIESPVSHLCLIPPQAKKVNLAGFHGQFTPEVMKKLGTHLNGDDPVILKMTAAGALIHKRDTDGKIVNINTLVLGVDLNMSGSRASPVKNGTGIYNPRVRGALLPTPCI